MVEVCGKDGIGRVIICDTTILSLLYHRWPYIHIHRRELIFQKKSRLSSLYGIVKVFFRDADV